MPISSGSRILKYLQQLRVVGENDSDRELLQRFAHHQDEAAFSLLVRRHGSMVLSVCRRVLRNHHDAEDAFQATFLVLARKAGSVNWQASVAGWLFVTAQHVATKAKTRIDHRRNRVAEGRDVSEAEFRDDPSGEEMQRALDEELARMPEQFRVPLVLCCLEGKTRQQAAQQLGCTTAAVKDKLERGRDHLRRRLQRRGFTLSIAAVGLLLADCAVAVPLPVALVKVTVKAASIFTGNLAAGGIVSAQAAALAEGALQSMFVTKLKTLAFVLMSLLLLGGSVGALAWHARPDPAAAQEKDAPKTPQPERKNLHGEPLPAGAVAQLGAVRWNHGSTVGVVRYAPDGKQLFTAGGEELVVWDASTGKRAEKFRLSDSKPKEKGDPVRGNVEFSQTRVVCSADLQTVAACLRHGIVVWHIGKEAKAIGRHAGDYFIALSPDGKTLAAVRGSREYQIVLTDVATGKEIASVKARSNKIAPGHMLFSPDGALLASVRTTFTDSNWNNLETNEVWLLDAKTGKEVRQLKDIAGGRGGIIRDLAFSPDGKVVASVTHDGLVRLHETATGKHLRSCNEGRPTPYSVWSAYAHSLLFSSDGKLLAARNLDGAVRLHDVSTGKEVRTIGAKSSQRDGQYVDRLGSRRFDFAPDGKTLAIAEGEHVRLWAVATGTEVLPLDHHRGGIVAIAVAADGRTATTVGSDWIVYAWDLKTGKAQRHFQLPVSGGEAVLSPDGRTIAFGTTAENKEHAIHLWDAIAGKELRVLELPVANQFHGTGAPMGLAFSADGKVLALKARNPALYLWDVATGKNLGQLTRQNAGSLDHTRGPIGFSPDGKVVAVPGKILAKQFIELWDAETGLSQRQIALKPGTGVKPGNLVGEAYFRSECGVYALAFAPGGRTLATANVNDTISLWETATGTERFQIATPAHCLAFSPDGKILAGADDRTIRFWDSRTGKALGQFEGHQAAIQVLAFSPDGRQLISGSKDTTAIVWELSRLQTPAGVPAPAVTIETHWADLGSEDAAKALRARDVLLKTPKETVALLRKALQKPESTPGVDGERIERLIKDLDSGVFQTRTKARTELETIGPAAASFMRKALTDRPSLEVQKTLQSLLAKVAPRKTETPSPEVLRGMRAIELLELLATPEARQLLESLAAGPPDNVLTGDARAALKRLDSK